ncbi:MAG: amino acid adenylation domain-containing protein, partial [Acidobacteria bacterium]|nr:amino acid adenylation domain-containing protein [Acidobacteriota bacterium]
VLIEKGVLPDNIVGIMMERSIEMIIGIFGILKAGGAYLPIDPSYPQERIDYILKDSQATLTINCEFLKEAPQAHFLQHSAFSILHSNHLCYVIYTSGTTGQPKGSLIEHRNVVRLLFNDKFQFDFTNRDCWTLFHSFCFDFSVWEMYGALLYGGKLLIVPKMIARDTAEFLDLLNKEAVTVLNQTPSAFYNLVNEALTSTSHRPGKELYIKYVIFGGEALNPLKLKNWLEKYPHPQTRLINMFGITETTVHVTYKEITEKDIELNNSNIGNPIPTLNVYILDKYLKPVPVGIKGEICVGGEGVVRGYLNRPELTADRFIYQSPITNHQSPIYKSGDLARYLSNGDIEYLGRMDHQVKIRGFRIELGEIENRLLDYDGIKDAVVAAEATNSEKYLCAYIVPYKEFSITGLRTHLAAKLPDYMIPAYFIRLEKIPLTSNGKVDRKALPNVHGSDGLREEATSPTTETENKLVELWANVLGIKPGINADFFHSGGDSIKAVRLVNAINTGLSTNLKIADIYLHGTIKKLASIIDRDKTGYVYKDEELKKVLVEIDALKNRLMHAATFPPGIEDIFPMSDIQEGMVFHSLKEKEAALYHDQMVYQPVIKNFKPGILKKAFILMVAKHPILRTVFNLNTFEVPVQLIHRQIPYDIIHEDISYMEKKEQETYLLRFLAEDRKKVFPLDIPPLWRLRTFDLGGDTICVVLVAHHAILDGWSVASLDTELLNTYWQLSVNPAFTPGTLKNTYKAFILEQAVEKKRGDAADFWRNELDGYKRFELPKPLQTNEDGNKAGRYLYDLGKNLLSKLKETAKVHHTTLKSLCFSAYIYMLNMLSYENEIVAGLVTNNRPLCDDGDKILGCFLNTIPVRIIIPAHISWLNYVRLVDKKLLELKKYERMPFFEIVRIMGENAQSGNPIFDVLFNYIDFHVLDQIQEDYGKNRAGKLQVEEKVTTNTAFDFSVSTTLGDFELIISYSESFFNQKMVSDLCCY